MLEDYNTLRHDKAKVRKRERQMEEKKAIHRALFNYAGNLAPQGFVLAPQGIWCPAPHPSPRT
jgi:hypothetical protein